MSVLSLILRLEHLTAGTTLAHQLQSPGGVANTVYATSHSLWQILRSYSGFSSPEDAICREDQLAASFLMPRGSA